MADTLTAALNCQTDKYVNKILSKAVSKAKRLDNCII
jgi:hypothetical protein